MPGTALQIREMQPGLPKCKTAKQSHPGGRTAKQSSQPHPNSSGGIPDCKTHALD